MEDLIKYLRDRNVGEEIIEKMVDDHIDVAVIRFMSDEELRHYLPRWGDCLAVRAFARNVPCADSDDRQSRRSELLNSLRATLESKRQGRCPKSSAVGNKRAEKETRRVEIGWKASDGCGNLRQVRAKSGGGTRHCSVDKHCLMSALLPTAVDLFFPSGQSPHGPSEDFEFTLQDFAGRLLPQEKTVSDVYKDSCVRILRVYLCSYAKTPDDHDESDTSGSPTDFCMDGGTSTVSLPLRQCPTGSGTMLLSQPHLASGTSIRTPAATVTTDTSTTDSRAMESDDDFETAHADSPRQGHHVVEVPQSSSDHCQSTVSPCPLTQTHEDEMTVLDDPAHDVVDASCEVMSHHQNCINDVQNTACRCLLITSKLDNQVHSWMQEHQHLAQLLSTLTSVGDAHCAPVVASVLDICFLQMSAAKVQIRQRLVQLSGECSGGNEMKTDCILMTDSEPTLEELLVQLRSRLDSTGIRNSVNVCRDNVLDGGFRAFSRKSFRVEHALKVSFAGEESQDDGGPMREFLTLALQSVQTLGIFSGQSNQRNLMLDYAALEKGTYRTVGRLLSYSLVHGGPQPNFFSQLLYDMVSGRSVEANVNNVSELIMQQQLRQLQEAGDEDSFTAAVSSMADLIELAGCISLSRSYVTRQQLVKNLCHFHCVARVAIALTQLQEGLSELGLLSVIQKYPDVMNDSFVFRESPLDACLLDALFSLKYSAEGSNRYRKELVTVTHWRDLLQDLEDTNELSKLLQFITGLDCIPPLGFSPPLSITFKHPEDCDANDFAACYPVVNTCSNIIRLPVLASFDEFSKNMMAAINMAKTFTLA